MNNRLYFIFLVLLISACDKCKEDACTKDYYTKKCSTIIGSSVVISVDATLDNGRLEGISISKDSILSIQAYTVGGNKFYSVKVSTKIQKVNLCRNKILNHGHIIATNSPEFPSFGLSQICDNSITNFNITNDASLSFDNSAALIRGEVFTPIEVVSELKGLKPNTDYFLRLFCFTKLQDCYLSCIQGTFFNGSSADDIYRILYGEQTTRIKTPL